MNCCSIRLVAAFMTLFSAFACAAQFPPGLRQHILLDTGWRFHFSWDVHRDAPVQEVSVPHTWNAHEVSSGSINYTRTTGIYRKKIKIEEQWKTKRVFLFFEGANSVADVFVDGKFAGEHRGGYTSFCIEISSFIKGSATDSTELMVHVNNAIQPDVLPLSGDFNIYGGLHRPVSLIITSADCISLLDHASPGVYISQPEVSRERARIEVQTKLSRSEGCALRVKTSVFDRDGNPVAAADTVVSEGASSVRQSLLVKRPHLWNGKDDPYLYRLKVELFRETELVDAVEQPLGIRYFRVDPEKGFFLNGSAYDLYGFGLHEDVKGKGSAVSEDDLSGDMDLVMESGATALRLTHYPHRKVFYDLCDQNGLVVWSEIPLVGPGGYTGTGFFNNPALRTHAQQVLAEMILQNYNHPSVCFWGLFNELKLDGDDPVSFLAELNRFAKQTDPGRLTTCASFLDNDTFNGVSDLIAWNKYYGWYGGEFSAIGSWADQIHQKFPQKPIAVSEYGAGADPKAHQIPVTRPDPSGPFHPEEWQTLYHEQNWQELRRRPFLWGKFIWALTDFGSSVRDEGAEQGINDKGLVTYDRLLKKDAFFFYKANWSKEPMVHIAEKRYGRRTTPVVSVKVFTNCRTAELIVNGVSLGSRQKNDLSTLCWEQVRLKKGYNRLTVRGRDGRKTYEDACVWLLDSQDTKN